jgi:CRP/FNR family cyclic AMP-dependent transcriptional regulator
LHSTKVLALEYRKTFVDAKRLALSCSAEARLGKILLDWGRSVCTEPDLHFEMSVSHAELGEMAGRSRETVTRTLAAFRRRKWVSIQGATMCILQPEALAALCV